MGLRRQLKEDMKKISLRRKIIRELGGASASRISEGEIIQKVLDGHGGIYKFFHQFCAIDVLREMTNDNTLVEGRIITPERFIRTYEIRKVYSA